MGLENNEVRVELGDTYFEKIVYWSICKYVMDDYKTEQSSSKTSLIGGFIDRWLNTAPQYLIFNEVLKNENYTVLTDLFIYSSSKAKNAPDVIGLVDNQGIAYPFAKFYDDEWKFCEEAPFIEMKTFRHNHNLVTIPCNQFFDDHYYAIVESHIEKDYLTYLFVDSFFNNYDYFDIRFSKDYKTFIESNENDVIKKPEKLNKNKKIGSYNLIGVYKGKSLKELEHKVAEQGDKPFYFFEVTESAKSLDEPRELLSGNFYFNDDENNIPCDIKIDECSKITLINKIKEAIDVYVEGNVEVDGIPLEEGFHRLEFKFYKRECNCYKFSKHKKPEKEFTKPRKIPSGYFYFNDDENNIPCDIKIDDGSELTLVNENSDAIDVYVEGNVEVDGIPLEEGLRRLKFKYFSKDGKDKEIIFTKSSLRHYHDKISSLDDLISDFEDFINNSD